MAGVVGSSEFSVTLPEDASLVLGIKSKKVLADTPTMAEIIFLIGRSPEFQAKDHERTALLEIAHGISGRYSGHPKY